MFKYFRHTGTHHTRLTKPKQTSQQFYALGSDTNDESSASESEETEGTSIYISDSTDSEPKEPKTFKLTSIKKKEKL